MTTLMLAAATAVATNLPPIVVEASRLDRTPLEIPSAVHVLACGEVAAAGARDAVDLLAKSAPELHIRRMGAANPALSELSMRGYGEAGHGRTLVLVDGERLNAPDLNAPDLSRIALGGAARVEILGGPQTVLHGDGASAGVINVVTEPQDFSRRSYAGLRVGSWGTAGASAGTRGGVEDEGLKYWADGAYDRSDGYRAHSGYGIWNLNGGVRKDWEGGTWLRVSGFFNDADYDLPGALGRGEWKDARRRSYATEDCYRRGAFGFNATLDARLDDENAVKLTATFSERRMRAHQRGETWRSDNDYGIASFRGTGEWINTADVFGLGNESILGAQYACDFLDGRTNAGAGWSDYDYDRQGMDFFVQDTLHLTDVFALQPGARYARTWSFNSLAKPRRKQEHLGAFELALVINPTEASKVYVKGVRSYRNPFLDETPYDIRTWTPAGLLDPELGWTAEIGAAWDVTDELTAGADVYCTWLEDEIFYNAVAGNNVNADGRTVRRGADVRVAWERERTAGFALAASYVKATFDGGAFGGNAVPLVPGVTVTASGRVWLWNECFVFGGYRFQDAMYSCSDFNNAFGRMDGFGVFHVGVGYEPAFAEWIEGVKVVLTVDNLLDRRYCDYAAYGTSFYPAAGRSLTLSLRYEF